MASFYFCSGNVGYDEIDVFEFGGSNTNKVFITVHAPIDGEQNQDQTEFNSNVDYSLDWHIYSIEWDKYFLRWKIDGVTQKTIYKLFQLNGAEVGICDIIPGYYNIYDKFPTNKMALIAGMGISAGNFASPLPDETTQFPSQFEIDYIRVYQRDPQEGFQDLCIRDFTCPQIICDNNQYTCTISSGIGSGSNYNWQVSSGLSIVSTNNNSITFRTQPGYNGVATIKVICSNDICGERTFSKNIWIGAPIQPNIKDNVPKCKKCYDLEVLKSSDYPSTTTFRWEFSDGTIYNGPVIKNRCPKNPFLVKNMALGKKLIN